MSPTCIVLDGLGNGLNVGSIMRTAEAFGFTDVRVVCARKYRNKNLSRASRGAHALLDITYYENPREMVDDLERSGFRIVVVTETGATAVDCASYADDVALVFGNEGVGPSKEARDAAYGSITIPMCGFSDSLNNRQRIIMTAKAALIEFTRNQKIIFEALVAGSNAVTLIVGPAGTGKTRLSLIAAAQIAKREKKELVYTRPLVTPGGSMGHLPGDIHKKMAPFVEHILADSRDVLPRGLEVRPLQTMRGTTFKDVCLVADEMQNSTIDQAKMLLTRVGEGARLVLAGDEEQSDLQGVRENGLSYFARAVRENEDCLKHIRLFELTHDDIVRSEAVREILSLAARTRPL